MEGKESVNNEKTEFSDVDRTGTETSDEETGEVTATSPEVNAMLETPADRPSTSRWYSEETGGVTSSSTEVNVVRATPDSTAGCDAEIKLKLSLKKILRKSENSSDSDSSTSRTVDEFIRNQRELISPLVSPVQQLPEDETCSSDIDRVDDGSMTSQQSPENSGMKSSTDTSVEANADSEGSRSTRADSGSGLSSHNPLLFKLLGTDESRSASTSNNATSSSENAEGSSATGTDSPSELKSQNPLLCSLLRTGESKSRAESTSANEISSSGNSEITRTIDPRIAKSRTESTSANEASSSKKSDGSSATGTDSPSELKSQNPLLSSLLRTGESKSRAESTSANEISSSENSEITRTIDPHVANSRAESTSANETINSENSEVTHTIDPHLDKSRDESTSGNETSGSENSEITRINNPRITMSSLEYSILDTDETRGSSIFSDICSESPPQITSEPKSEAPGVFKIPPLKPDTAKTPKKSPNSSNLVTSDSGSSGKKSTDLSPGKASSEFYESGQTKLVSRPSQSLPNVNRSPRDAITRGSVDLNIAKTGVVRSLFTGNFDSDQPTNSGAAISNTSERSQNSGSNREFNQNRNTERVSENIQGSSSEVTHSKSKACRKLTYAPPDRETNANEMLPEDSWLEEFGEVSGQHSQEVPLTPDGSCRENTTTKRKRSAPATTERTSPKKLRSSSVSTAQNISERAEQLEQVKPSSTVQRSPKRKAEDLESSSNSEASFSDGPKEGNPPQSVIKRRKLKPQTRSDKIGVSSSSPDSGEESNTETEEK